jgi:5'(3')-deoxyribonucleotidase
MSVIRSKAIRRTDYLIDSYQVSFESGAGWHCVCSEFANANDCRHTREAQGRHAAQVLINNRLVSTIDRSGLRR